MSSNLKSNVSTLERAHSEIQQLQVASPVHMYCSNSKATTWTTTIGSSILLKDMNSGQGQTANACAVNGAQQQYDHQRQVTLPNFQQSFDQYIKRQVSQIIDVGRASPACLPTESPTCLPTESPACLWTESPACLWTESPACLWTESPACLSTESPVYWPPEAPIGVQAVAGLRHENMFQLEGLHVSGLQGLQVQGNHTPQIISNAQILQSHGTYSNLIAEGAVSSSPNYQHIEGVIPNQTVNAGTEISSHQQQKLPDDPNKWQKVATVTNPATMNTPNKLPHVNENAIPNLAFAATTTTAKLNISQTSNSELNAPRRTQRYASCTCPYCINHDKRNSESRAKHICHFPDCSRVFKKPSRLKVHIRTHTGEKPFVCPWMSCGKRYGRLDQLQRHERTHTTHQQQKLPDDPNKWQKVATVTNPATMNTPNKLPHVNENAIPNLAFAATTTTAKLNISQTSNSELNAPRRTQRYALCICPNCINPDKRNSESRAKHICHFPDCSRVFKKPSRLKVHIRTHTGEKPFVCPRMSCGKRYGRLDQLQRHERTHTTHQQQNLPDDPNKWQKVATVTNPATMNTPNKLPHVNENATPNLAFAATTTTAKLNISQTSNSELNAPRRTQRNSESREKHICNFPDCSRVFKYASRLKDHIRTHTDEKPFVCPWMSCGKRYKRLVHLLRHERTHTNEKRFQCTKCIKRFKCKDHLSLHLKRQHSKWTLQVPR